MDQRGAMGQADVAVSGTEEMRQGAGVAWALVGGGQGRAD